MKNTLRLLAATILFAPSILLTGCGTQEVRTNALINRQDRIDARTEARQERWEIRSSREDARAAAFVENH